MEDLQCVLMSCTSMLYQRAVPNYLYELYSRAPTCELYTKSGSIVFDATCEEYSSTGDVSRACQDRLIPD